MHFKIDFKMVIQPVQCSHIKKEYNIILLFSCKLLLCFLAACHEANTEQPFMCLDLTFIWALLEKGFGLNENARVYVSTLFFVHIDK